MIGVLKARFAGLSLAFSFCFVVPVGQAQEVDRDFVVDSLREYCQACHAVGQLKFLTSGNNDEVWEFLWSKESPRTPQLWGDLIIEVLDWPVICRHHRIS